MAIEQIRDRWANASADERRVFEQEGLILQVTEEIWEALESKGWNKAQLANALGKSKSYVTQLLNGSRNMTLRTLSDICFALGVPVRVRVGEPKSLKLCWADVVTLSDGDSADIVMPVAQNSLSYESDIQDGWKFESIQKVAA